MHSPVSSYDLNHDPFLVFVLVGASLIGYMIISEWSKITSKKDYAFLPWQVDQSRIKFAGDQRYFILAKNGKYRIYFPSETDSTIFGPFWVPLVRTVFGYDCGPVDFNSEEEALAALRQCN